ncbi:MAG: nucleotide exchange factor GrpE [Bacteroidota bacterium]
MDEDKKKDTFNSTEKPQGTETTGPEIQPSQETVDLTQAKIAELEQSVNQLKDQLLRKAAEFDNYKRRSENDMLATIQYANEELLEALLPVIDDFERSMKVDKERKDFDALYTGIELIYQKLMKILDSKGMKAYDVVGKPFNTDYHDALLQIPRKDVAPHTVVEEVEKGYTLFEKVLRHAKVIVSGDHETDTTAQTDNKGQDK